jgi:hypothetical protein
MSTETIVIATSSPKDRPEYLADFLNCLAYPKGHTATFSYRYKWIEDGVAQRIKDLKNGESLAGLVVYCASKAGSSEFSYYPVRHASIIGIEPREILRLNQQNDDTHFSIQLELGRYVSISPRKQSQWDVWSKWVSHQDPSPLPENNVHGSSAIFVFQRTGFAEESDTVDQETSWTQIINKLVEVPILKDCCFFRIGEVHEKKAPGQKLQVKRDSGLGSIYSLQSPGEFLIDLKWHRPGLEVPKANVVASSVSIVGPITRSFGRQTHGTILLKVARLYETETVALEFTYSNSALGTESPTPRLLFSIKPAGWILVTVVVLLAIGSFLTGMTKEAVEQVMHLVPILSPFAQAAAVFSWAAKALGAFLVGLGGYLGFRRLPKGLGDS